MLMRTSFLWSSTVEKEEEEEEEVSSEFVLGKRYVLRTKREHRRAFMLLVPCTHAR